MERTKKKTHCVTQNSKQDYSGSLRKIGKYHDYVFYVIHHYAFY
jgi:hypothetical protein